MTLQALQNNNTVVIGNLEMPIVLIRAEFLAKSVQAGTLNKFSKAGLESQGPSVLSDHCNAEITQVYKVRALNYIASAAASSTNQEWQFFWSIVTARCMVMWGFFTLDLKIMDKLLDNQLCG